MVTINNLYEYAEKNNIDIISLDLNYLEGASVFFEEDNEYTIVINNQKEFTIAQFVTVLSHELGHCCTGALYNENTPVLTRGKCERRADEWSIEKLLPKHQILKAIYYGCREVWELSEFFNIDYKLIEKAIVYYEIPGYSY